MGDIYIYVLVGGWAYPSEKWWTSSVGMMNYSQYDGKVIKAMFQTTNQWCFKMELKKEFRSAPQNSNFELGKYRIYREVSQAHMDHVNVTCVHEQTSDRCFQMGPQLKPQKSPKMVVEGTKYVALISGIWMWSRLKPSDSIP